MRTALPVKSLLSSVCVCVCVCVWPLTLPSLNPSRKNMQISLAKTMFTHKNKKVELVLDNTKYFKDTVFNTVIFMQGVKE